ncbi:hypothetical protein Poli38472_012104 [Pythium oligandrum]|uniref:Amino acid transporter n=1 Tax=Pythium oligandrum TaxID=41045 RepID=A0A8K1FQW6_PYTOL|nr:hypothetical protein Poli38472_012104 [Pythium oligandrum]|eukprot:TMW66988.1 hypothetical protein Poli38472_012104 [Pythium oligandrum]
MTESYVRVSTPGNNAGDGVPHPMPEPRWKRLLFGVPGIVAGALIGILIGYGLQEADASAEVVSWVGIPGTLFIRAIKCLVAPLVFSSLVVGMSDMLAVGKASAIGWRTAIAYTLTTILASCQGLMWVVIFRPMFNNKPPAAEDTTPQMAFQCDKPGYFLSHANDTVQCVFDSSYNETSEFSSSSIFFVNDIKGSFAMSNEGFAKLSLTDTLQAQLFSIVPDNITQAFASSSLLSIIMFSIPFGISIALLPKEMKIISNVFREFVEIFMKLIGWIISLTPFAVISLLASSVAGQEDLGVLVSSVGVYIGAILVSLVVHTYIVYPILLRIFTPGNPFAWMQQMVRAQVFAVGCASSMATLPITMDCVDKSGEVSKTLYRFVLSLGATINMDGSALGFPIAVVFMAEAAGLGHLIGGVEYFLIILISTVGAIGTAPVPAAGIVMTMTIWTSIFPSTPLPSTFAFIVATDWFTDRFQTAVNVTGDTVVCRIVAYQVGETIEGHDRENLDSAIDGIARHNSELKEAMRQSHLKEDTTA